jgi:hypothetical protein
MPDRRAQLEDLQTHLTALVLMLRLDSRCQWTRHFEACLHRAESLAAGTPEQDELSTLSGSVMNVFGGMGSFNDYAPWQNGRNIPGMEALSDVSGAVYHSALALRSVEA